MEPIRLQIAEPTGRFQRQLRRYARGLRDCPAGGYHNASVIVGEVGEADAERLHGDNWPHDDLRWPQTCACGYVFRSGCGCGQGDCPDDDPWQRNDCAIYRLPDGTEFAWWGKPTAPAGTMIRADWYPSHDRGEPWLVVLPDGGTWITTQDASGGGQWTVTGTPPGITVSPSIWHDQPHGWHGFIRDGYLVDA